MLPVSYLALFAPIALALVARESGVGDFARREPGPCDVDACMDVIDSSACWNAVVMGNNKDLQSIFSCTAGGKTQMCDCYGCDSLLDKLVVDNQLCANSTAAARH